MVIVIFSFSNNIMTANSHFSEIMGRTGMTAKKCQRHEDLQWHAEDSKHNLIMNHN